MTQQQSILIGDEAVTPQEALTVLMQLIQSDENVRLKFTNQILAARLATIQASPSANGDSAAAVPNRAHKRRATKVKATKE